MGLKLEAVVCAVLACMACCGVGIAFAQGMGSSSTAGIYTCVDAKGRKITSDRPVPECIDRTQQEMTPSGTLKRVVGPTLTAQERAVLEEKEKRAIEARSLEQEVKRRDRALLTRYPNRVIHDKERGLALKQVDEVILTASKRLQELTEQRKGINADLEFYKKDANKAPIGLKRRLEENDSSVTSQKQFIGDQDLEKNRVNVRFDEELAKLKQLWPQLSPAAAPQESAPAAVPPAKKQHAR